MNEFWAAIIGVVVGGVITTLGHMIIHHWQTAGERQRDEKRKAMLTMMLNNPGPSGWRKMGITVTELRRQFTKCTNYCTVTDLAHLSHVVVPGCPQRQKSLDHENRQLDISPIRFPDFKRDGNLDTAGTGRPFARDKN